MLRRSLLVVLLLTVAGSALGDTPPNIVLVIGDDHGWPNSGFMGHPVVQTPVLDTLAAEGTVFPNAHLPASLCRVSLQTLLSGLHPEEWRAKTIALNRDEPIPYRQEVEHFRTLPRELARRGYRSWQGGKMWEGSFQQAGFEDGTAGPGPFGVFMFDELGRRDWSPETCGPTRTEDLPCPAMAPLNSFLQGIDDEPFFLWFAPMLPHTPFDPPIEFLLPYFIPSLTLGQAIYMAQVSRLDAVIGEMLRELESNGVLENTVVIYVSDNGWELENRTGSQFGHGKGTMYELGMRTPMIFHWPGHIPAGVVRDDLVTSEDLFPTILDYAGAEQLPDRRGTSLRRGIATGEPVGLDAYVSFFLGNRPIFTGHYVRTPDWRYIDFEDGHEELYEIIGDPYETVDLAAQRPELLPAFRQEVLDWDAETRAAPTRLEIAGRLVDLAGTAIAGASLRLLSESEQLEARTDGDGAFRFQVLPHGNYELAPGRGLTQLLGEPRISLPVGPTGSYLPQVLGVPDEATRPDDFGSTISGRLATRGGLPIADTRVVVRNMHRRVDLEVTVRTDADGRYLAENLPAGRYLVRPELPPELRVSQGRTRVRRDEHRVRDLVVTRRHLRERNLSWFKRKR